MVLGGCRSFLLLVTTKDCTENSISTLKLMITKHGIDFVRIQHKGLIVQLFHVDHCFCKVKNSLCLTRLFISR